MPDGFKIADAFVDVEVNIDRRSLDDSARQAGTRAGETAGEHFVRGTDGRLRNSKGQFASAGDKLGGDTGEALVGGLSRGLTGFSSAVTTNPYVLATAGGLAAILTPMIGSAIAAGTIIGVGGGLIGLGAVLLKEEPALVAAATKLKNTTVSVFREAAQPMLDPFVDALGDLKDLVTEQKTNLKTMFEAVAPAIMPLTHGLGDLVEGAMPGFVRLAQEAGPALKELAPSLGELGNAIGIALGMIADVGPEATVFFKDLITWISGSIIAMGAVVFGLTKAYSALRWFFTSIPGWVSSAIDWFKELGSDVGSFFTDTIPGWFKSAGSGIGGFFSGLWGKITGFFSSLATGVANTVTSVINWFQALPGRIWAFLQAVPGMLWNALVAGFDAVTTGIGYAIGTAVKLMLGIPVAIGNMVNAAWAWLKSLPDKAASAMTSLANTIKNAWQTAKTWTINTASSLVTSAVNFLKALPGKAAVAVASLANAVAAKFIAAKTQATSTVTSLVSTVVSFLKALPGKAASAVSSFASTVAGKLRAAVSSAKSIGQDIIRGIIDGIGSMVGAAAAAAARAAKNILNGAKKALGISSPSREADREVGRWILPGVTRGVQKTLPAARGAMADAMSSLLPGPDGITATVSGQASGGTGATGPVNHFAPGAIVLDASRMKSIADLVNMINRLTPAARAYRAPSGFAGA